MTVREMKAKLAEFPDDTRVYATVSASGETYGVEGGRMTNPENLSDGPVDPPTAPALVFHLDYGS